MRGGDPQPSLLVRLLSPGAAPVGGAASRALFRRSRCISSQTKISLFSFPYPLAKGRGVNVSSLNPVLSKLKGRSFSPGDAVLFLFTRVSRRTLRDARKEPMQILILLNVDVSVELSRLYLSAHYLLVLFGDLSTSRPFFKDPTGVSCNLRGDLEIFISIYHTAHTQNREIPYLT